MFPLIKKKINNPQDFYLKTKHPELYPDYYGTYNLIHRLDGKIVAVTVIDILTNYLSSLYCYYDPDFSFLDLGVVTAIREIEYMKSFQELIDKNFTYYTMGKRLNLPQNRNIKEIFSLLKLWIIIQVFTILNIINIIYIIYQRKHNQINIIEQKVCAFN